ncbi:hypothetical protein [Paenibacillus brevis]|uniref:hypothetical protein n=1 Tax=Paenibacillus brevis TaxID=2841508 RepID=UPI00201AACE6|nr:hypothetical protein [Paenibacillus brevis]
MSISLFVIGVTCVLCGLIGSSAFAAFVGLSFLMGAAAPLFNGPYMAMIQKSYDPEKLGRVLSFVTSIGRLASGFYRRQFIFFCGIGMMKEIDSSWKGSLR